MAADQKQQHPDSLVESEGIVPVVDMVDVLDCRSGPARIAAALAARQKLLSRQVLWFQVAAELRNHRS